MKVRTDSERVRHSRKMVMEFLASSVDLSTAPEAQLYVGQYGAEPDRYGPPAPPDSDRDRKRAGHHELPDGQTAATVHQPVKVDNDLYVRDYSKCILCYKCVDACGEQYQNTFAIHVAGRGFDARISTEFNVELPESACVYCGNCIAVCPTGALMPSHAHDLPLLRRGLQPGPRGAGQRDRSGGLARRPRRDPREPVREGPLRVPARASEGPGLIDLDALAARTPAPGGGAATAWAVGIAAALVEMGAAFADQPTEAAAALRARAAELADAELHAYAPVLEAQRAGDAEGVASALSRAAGSPLNIARAASEVAELGASVVASGKEALK